MPVIQLVSSWRIKENEPYEMQVARTTMDLLAKNSVIANTVTAISMDINKAQTLLLKSGKNYRWDSGMKRIKLLLIQRLER